MSGGAPLATPENRRTAFYDSVNSSLFRSAPELREKLAEVEASQGRSIKLEPSKSGGKNKAYICCSCATFVVKATKQCTQLWKISGGVFNHAPTCMGRGRANAASIANLSASLVRANPAISGPALSDSLRQMGGFNPHIRTVQRAKQRLASASRDEVEENYTRLQSYMEYIERNCPGSVATVEEENGRFKRSFLMLGAAAHIAANSTPKVVSMDAGHLKGDWNGVLLVLSAKDSNNRIILIATAVADKETKSNYEFLLRNCLRNEEMKAFLGNASTTVFIDGHKGALTALAEVVPNLFVRRCVRHIITNIQKLGSDRSPDVYQAARAPTGSLFEAALKEIKKQLPVQYSKLMSYERDVWANYASSKDRVTLNQVTSNLAESSIAMIGAETRARDPMRLHEEVAIDTAKKITERAEEAGQYLTSFATGHLKTERDASMTYQAVLQPNHQYVVRSHVGDRQSNRVNLKMHENTLGMECTCAFPSRFRLPCRHVLAALRQRNMSEKAEELIHEGYKLSRYREIHSDDRFPVVLPIWNELQERNLQPPLPVEGQAGAPKKGRKRKSRFPGKGDNNQRGHADAGCPAQPRVTGVGINPFVEHGRPAGSGSSTLSELSQGAIDLSQTHDA